MNKHLDRQVFIRAKSFFVILFLLLISNQASALKLNLGAQTGFGRFDYEKKLDGILSYQVAQLSFGVSHKQIYSTLAYSRNFQDISISEEEDIGSANRYDIDFTLGYRFTKSWSVFTGYKSNKTELSLESRDADFLDDFELDDLDSDELDLDELVQVSREDYYKQDGFFLGLGYTTVFNKNVFGLSLAYARLDTENQFVDDSFSDDDGDPFPIDLGDLQALIDSADFEFDDLTGEHQGVSQGYSFGAHFLAPISDQLYFQAQYKINDYTQTIEYLGFEFDADETYESLMVGVVYLL